MKRFLYAVAFFGLMCWNEHRVWNGHGDKWWISLFCATCFGMNLASEGLDK